MLLSSLTPLLKLTQLRFLLVGGSVFLIDLSLFYAGHFLLGWSSIHARITAFIIAISLSWLGNRWFTFKHINHRPWKGQLLSASWVSCCAAALNLSVFHGLAQLLPDNPTMTIFPLAAGVLAGLCINWLGAKYLTFKPVSTQVG